ncbi:hypothetical protein D3C71_1218720 [compost metagenome]
MQQCAELADERQADGEDRRPGHDFRVVVLGQHHCASHFGVGGVGRSAEQTGGGGGNAVTEQGAVQAGLLQVIATGHATDGDHAADVLNGRSQGYRNDEQDRLPVEFRRSEVRDGEPRCSSNLRRVDHAEIERHAKTHQHAGDDRHQAENTFAEHRDDQGRQQRGHRDQHRGLIMNQLATVTGLAHRHVGGNRRHGQADGDDHRADHHRWQQAIDEASAFDLHGQAEEGVDETGRHHTAHGRGEAELALGENDRRDEGKTRCQEHRHLTPGDDLEQDRPQTCGKQRHVRIKAGNQRHQHQGAEGHEQHLGAGQHRAPERIVELLLHAHASFCLVPKILSPASPRPGMM